MKCFNHIEVEAVATCQRCGKGLCRECAAKYSPCYCDECYTAVCVEAEERSKARLIEARSQKKQMQSERNARKRAALIDTNAELIKAIILGVVFWALGSFVMNALDVTDAYISISMFPFFFTPFGWSAITYAESKVLPGIIFPLPLLATYLAIKLILSIVVGIPMFLFQIIRWVMGLVRAAATK